jgi:outer membrane protein TolC
MSELPLALFVQARRRFCTNRTHNANPGMVTRYRTQRFLPALLSLFLFLLAGTSYSQSDSPALRLTDAVQEALMKNPRIQAAALLAESRKMDYKQARSYYLPHVTAEAAFERGNNPGFVVSRMMQQGWFDRRFLNDPLLLQSPEPLSNAHTLIQVNQVIYDGGSIRAGMNMALAGRQAEEAQKRSSESNLAAEVSDAYLQILQLRSQLDVVETAIRGLESMRQTAENLYQQGMAIQADVMRIGVRQAEVEREKIALLNGLRLARINLARLLDADENNPPNVALRFGPFKQLPVETLESYEKQLLADNPDLKALDETLKAKVEGVRKERAEYLPKLGAMAGWEYNNSTTGHRADGYIAGIGLRWDLLDGFSREARIAKARLEVQELQARHREAEAGLRLALHKAWLDLDTAQSQVNVAKVAVDQAGEAWRTIKDRYENGMTTIDDVLAAETSQKKAAGDLVQSMQNYALHYILLGRAIGTPQSLISVVEKELLQ